MMMSLSSIDLGVGHGSCWVAAKGYDNWVLGLIGCAGRVVRYLKDEDDASHDQGRYELDSHPTVNIGMNRYHDQNFGLFAGGDDDNASHDQRRSEPDCHLTVGIEMGSYCHDEGLESAAEIYLEPSDQSG